MCSFSKNLGNGLAQVNVLQVDFKLLDVYSINEALTTCASFGSLDAKTPWGTEHQIAREVISQAR